MTQSAGWIDPDRYPFDSHWLDVSGGRMHYVDEGSGPPVLFLHGNPTWSFMYRDAIDRLSDDHRCLAPDHIGFGLSDKPFDWEYRPWQHAANVIRLVQDLKLREFHLVVHDWGGPIGVSVAQDLPDRILSMTVLNTLMWPMNSSLRAQLFSRVFGSSIGRYLIQNWALFEKWLMPWGISKGDRFKGDVHRHYTAPFEEPGSRKGIWRFPRDIIRAGEWLGNLWRNRRVLSDIPALLVWGMQDPVFTKQDLERWKRVFNRRNVFTYPGASHFVMEDAGSDVAVRIHRFLAG